MDALDIIYRLNEGFVPPNQYLGDNVKNVQLEDGRVFCFTNCVDYLNIAIENINNSLGMDKTALNNYVYGHRSYSYSFRP